MEKMKKRKGHFPSGNEYKMISFQVTKKEYDDVIKLCELNEQSVSYMMREILVYSQTVQGAFTISNLRGEIEETAKAVKDIEKRIAGIRKIVGK